MAQKVSIQGYEGSFHHIAAQAFLGEETQIIPCDSFSQVVSIAADNSRSTGGLMAIENSIAGSILPNYSLLLKSGLEIRGEIYLQIHQNLLVNKGVSLGDIREVHSHPMALLQCSDFLQQHSWKLVETEDTAKSAKHLSQHRSRHVAVIASSLAAQLFDLEVAAPSIQTFPNNYTRFLFLQPSHIDKRTNHFDKASIHFHTDHSRGSLARVLTAIANEGVNLSKLQSMPISGQEWQYGFHADMELETEVQFENVISAIKPLTSALAVLGVYKKGGTIR